MSGNLIVATLLLKARTTELMVVSYATKPHHLFYGSDDGDSNVLSMTSRVILYRDVHKIMNQGRLFKFQMASSAMA